MFDVGGKSLCGQWEEVGRVGCGTTTVDRKSPGLYPVAGVFFALRNGDFPPISIADCGGETMMPREIDGLPGSVVWSERVS